MSNEENVDPGLSAEIEKAIDVMEAEAKNDAAVEEVVTEGTTEGTTNEVTSEVSAETAESTEDKDTGTEDAGEVVRSGDTTGSVASGDGDTEGDDGSQTLPPVISDVALTRAVQAGIPLADAREFANEAALDRNVAIIERMREIRREQAVEEAEEVKDPFADLPKLDPEKFEPEVIEAFEKITDIVKGQSAELDAFKNHQDGLTEAQQVANTKEVTQFFDEQITGLGDEFSDALGQGDTNSLPRGGMQFAAREQIAEQMSVLLLGYDASNLTPPPREEVFDAAARSVLQKEYQQIHDKELSGKLEKQATQHLQRAGGSQDTSTLTAEEEVVQALDSKFGVGK